MKTPVLVPNLPESVADATLVAWHKKAGEMVEKGENLVDLETDKVVLEVPAPESGILSEVMQANESTVTSGTTLALIETAQAGATPVTSGSRKQEAKSAPQPSPTVRRLLLETGFNADGIPASGKNGRLTKNDVLTYMKSQSKAQRKTEEQTTVSVESSGPPVVDAGMVPGDRAEQRVPMTRLRARVAERLIQAQRATAMLTTFNEVDLRVTIDLRNRHKEGFLKKHGVKLGFMSFFVKATTMALQQFPIVNASVDDNDIIYHGYYDIGIAVASDRGLVVPILRNTDQMNLPSIEKQIRDFGAQAKDGRLSFEDLTGGTFTITNGGVFGSMLSTPIINPPQSAILGMHAIKDRAIVEQGEVLIRPMMYLALSYDHRIIDGREAVLFLTSIKQGLEDPDRLLLNI
jgi:2-oxoglutarate dehydrogenase E2 component (dihydrolipoamide succinyltransferase)